MSYEYSLVMEDALSGILAFNGVSFFSSSLVNIVVYVFTAFSLYTMATRRGISKPWLAWVPIVNVWILGSLSDQYRYVSKGEIRGKRKSLAVLSVIQTVVYIAVVVLGFLIVGNVFFGMMNHVSEQLLLSRIMGLVISLLVVCLPLIGVAISRAILYYMALYDVYTSCDVRNNVVYLVLSIIPGVCTIAKPLFLFLCRDKDGGMPPRREPSTVYAQEQSAVWEEPEAGKDPWETKNQE